MQRIGLERIIAIGRVWIDGFFRLTGQGVLDTPPANNIHLYAKDNSGSMVVAYKDPTGTETILGPAGVTDHGALTGLADNDHPQYVLHTDVDDVPVNGVTTDPISSNWAYDHENAADPHTGYRLESADHTHQSTGLQAGQLDHGLALTGLTDDDHTQYLLASAATDRATFAANWTDLTDGGETALHTHSTATAPGHTHGITRLTGDGSTTVFNLLDIAEYMTDAVNDGIGVDDLDYTLSADGSQVTFSAAPLAGNVLHLGYVLAGI